MPPRRQQQSGLSLVELIVAMVIGLTVVGAALAMYVSSGFTSRGSGALSQMTEDASIALSLLRSQVAMAGYSRPTGVGADGTLVKQYTGTAVFGCTGGATADTKAGLLNSMACADNGALPDSIAVLYQADTGNTVPTTASIPTDCLGNGITINGAFYVAENRYYVDNGTLMCLGNGSTMPQPLVENVFDLKILYGVAGTNSPGGTTLTNGVAERYLTAQETSDTKTPPVSSALWQQVTSARICVVVRSETAVLEEDAPYFDCAGAPQTPSDKHLYRAFTTTVVLQNRLTATN